MQEEIEVGQNVNVLGINDIIRYNGEVEFIDDDVYFVRIKKILTTEESHRRMGSIIGFHKDHIVPI